MCLFTHNCSRRKGMTNEKKKSYNTKNSMTEYEALVFKIFF